MRTETYQSYQILLTFLVMVSSLICFCFIMAYINTPVPAGPGSDKVVTCGGQAMSPYEFCEHDPLSSWEGLYTYKDASWENSPYANYPYNNYTYNEQAASQAASRADLQERAQASRRFDATAIWVSGIVIVALLMAGFSVKPEPRFTPAVRPIPSREQQTRIRNLNSVTQAEVHYVAVGDRGTILTSPDGCSWTPQLSGTSQTLYVVTWLGTQFVAVGERGTILTSPDGCSWTAQTSGTLCRLLGVASSDSQIVVVGNRGTILTSPDGRTWIKRPSGTGRTLFAVAWPGSQFVVVGNKGVLLTSSDGIIWSIQRYSPSPTVSSIVWAEFQR